MKRLRPHLCIVTFLIAGILFGQDLKPTDKLALIDGSVMNFKKSPLKKETIIFQDVKTKKEIKVTGDDKGKFKILIPVGAKYSIKYKNFSFDMNYSEMEIPADPNSSYALEVFIEPPKEISLDNVLFDSGKSTLKPASTKPLNDLYDFLVLKNTMVVEIQGHTDNVGKPEDNMKLSGERAKVVMDFLVKKGIDPKRLTAKGYGDTRPIADNSTPEGKAKNRRTYLVVVKD
jgi:OmpA-OmpF porin, OOP family